jgi:hypothetical protein
MQTEPTINDYLDAIRVPLDKAVERTVRIFEDKARGAARSGQTGNAIQEILGEIQREFERSVSATLTTLMSVTESTKLDASDLRGLTAQELENFARRLKAIIRLERFGKVEPSAQRTVDNGLSKLDEHLRFALRQFDVGFFAPAQRPSRTRLSGGALPNTSPPNTFTPNQMPAYLDLGPPPTVQVVADLGAATEIRSVSTLAADGNLIADAKVQPSEKRTVIGRTLSANHAQIVLNIEAVVVFLDAKIEDLDRRNSDEARAELARYQQIKRELEKARDTARAFAIGKIPEDAAVEASKSFVEYIRAWWDTDHVDICRSTFKTAVFLSCAGICKWYGAEGDLAILLSGVITGGKQVADALQSAVKLVVGKKDAEN